MVNCKSIFGNNTPNYQLFTFMSQVCQLTGKRPQVGNNISHSNRKTRRRFNPNLTTKKFVDVKTGKTVKLKISIRAQRTLLKNPAKYSKHIAKLVAKRAR